LIKINASRNDQWQVLAALRDFDPADISPRLRMRSEACKRVENEHAAEYQA
jgi:hypothetical protein